MRFILDFVTQTAGLKNAQDLAQLLGEDLGDAEDAGKQMATALHAAAEKAQKDLKDTTAIADKLANALGPELTAKVNVDEIAGKFHRAGLTIDDVEGNIDSFRTSLSQMADTADTVKSRLGDVEGGVRKVGDETDRSRSVMANYLGNAAQEIPGLTGAFGPLNVAVGQFAEYAAEGGISLGGIASTIGPMAGVGAGIWYINNQLDLMKKKDAFHTDKVKAYETAISKGGDAAKNLADHIRELGKVEATTWGNAANPFADATQDVTDKLIKAGLTVDQYAQLVAGGTDKIRDWVQAQHDAGNSIDPGVIDALAQDTQDYADAAKNAAANTKFFGEKADTSSRQIDQLAGATGRWQKAWDNLDSSLKKEDAFANLTLSLSSLQGELADIAEQERTGAITHEEATAKTVIAINSRKEAADDYIQTILRMPAAMATQVNLLIDQGQYAQAKDLLATFQAMEKYSTTGSDGTTWEFGGHGGFTGGAGASQPSSTSSPQTVEAHTTVLLQFGHDAIQAITAVQQAQLKGTR